MLTAGIWLSLVVGWANAFYAVVAIWVALGRGWWFARAAVLCGLLLALLTLRTENYARAYDLYVPFALRSVLIIGGLLAWRAVAGWWRRRRTNVAPSRRISLRDLLLGMVLVAVLFTTARGSYQYLAADLYRELWRSLIWAGIGLAAVLAVTLPRWWLKWIPIVLGLAAAQLWLDSPFEWPFEELVASAAAGTALLLIISWTWLARRSRAVDSDRLLFRNSYSINAQDRSVVVSPWHARVATAVVVLPTVGLFAGLLSGPPPEEPPLDQHLAAIEALGETLPALHSVTKQGTLEIAAERSEEFAGIVPVIESADGFWGDLVVAFPRMSHVGKVASYLAVHAQLLTEQGSVNEANRVASAVAQMGRKTAEHPLLINLIFGWTLESIGMSQLAAQVTAMSAAERARLAAEINVWMQDRVDPEGVAAAERSWALGSGWKFRLDYFVCWLAGSYLLEGGVDAYGFDHTRLARLRMLLVKLAIEDFRQEHGRLPGALHELPCEPEHYQDPFSDRPLIYRLSENGDDYQLYSVGYNLTDDGGDEYADVSLPVSWWQVPFDVDIHETEAGEIGAEKNRPAGSTGDSS